MGLASWMDQIGLAEEVYTSVRLMHQRRMLPARCRSAWLVAVVDREPIGLARDKPQIYGTQFRVVAPCGLEPLPMRDPKNVDARRAALGLGPLEDYRKQVAEYALPASCRANQDSSPSR